MARVAGGLLLGLVLALAIFELALRAMAASPWWWALPAVSAQFDAPDPDIGYAHRPNAAGLWLRENRAYVRINALGLRDRPRTPLPAPGTIRIGVAGDSITEALQVNESDLFTLRSERALNARGLPVEVLNFGLSGAMPLQQLLLLARRGVPLGIEAAVMIFTGRDFITPQMIDDRTFPAYVETPSGDLTIGRAYQERRSHRWANQWEGRAFFWLVDHSMVADMLYLRAKLGFAQDAPIPQRYGADGDDCASDREALQDMEALFGQRKPEWAARRLDRFLADIKRLLGDRPTTLMMTAFGRPDACPQLEALHEAAVTHARTKLQSAGVGFVDLDTEIRSKLHSAGDYKRMFGFGARLGHGHLNLFGHDIYARVLTDVVEPQAVRLLAEKSKSLAK